MFLNDFGSRKKVMVYISWSRNNRNFLLMDRLVYNVGVSWKLLFFLFRLEMILKIIEKEIYFIG